MASLQLAGTPRKHLEATRAVVTATEWEAERERQVALNAKNTEIQQLGSKQDDHRRKFDQAITSKNQLVDEIRSVRDNVHGKLRVAKAKGFYDIGVADRALARAGQVALSARGEADRWQARAELETLHTRAVGKRNEESLARMQDGASVRIAETQRHGDARVDRGVRITGEHATNNQQVYQRTVEHLDTKEKLAREFANQKMTSAQLSRREADLKVRAAMDKAARGQVKAVEDLGQCRKEFEEKVLDAKRQLKERRWECDYQLASERVCLAQAKNIAGAMKEAHELQCDVNLGRLEDKINRLESHLEKKTAICDAELPVARKRNEEWLAKMSRDLEAAAGRAEREQLDAAQRVNAAKVTLGNLQAHCTAYISDLLRQWEEAKRVNASKVAAANERLREIEQFVQAHKQKCERHLDTMVTQTKDFAEKKTAYLEDKCSAIDAMAEGRVEMMQRQSRERRKQAEQRLAHLEEHIRDVRYRCDHRVRAEEATAGERVRIAKERNRENVERMDFRAREAAE
eukprot:CAMPEP_0171161140 /NCGR_PEP_ID=MMETSP0790-20130122/3919_1 /TAXON_ID=2925 /ORGANISM="Alexandrium catenella, Strain OF101" /LENGTH=516 /DNA_ID=CAMNT_0011625695 /DNA_START=78 /DNA_END=1625 /DNA_ORIENTATION=-